MLQVDNIILAAIWEGKGKHFEVSVVYVSLEQM